VSDLSTETVPEIPSSCNPREDHKQEGITRDSKRALGLVFQGILRDNITTALEKIDRRSRECSLENPNRKSPPQ
jgi:hypothetical protein